MHPASQQQPPFALHYTPHASALAEKFRPPHFIDGLIGVLQNVELVIHDPAVSSPLFNAVGEWSLFPWAKFRRHKAAIKMHTLLDLHGNIPTFISITDGKVHDVNILDEIMPEAGAFYVMDRGYIDFERLFVLTLRSAFFVVGPKSK